MHNGRYNGSINAAKLFSTFLVLTVYTGIGLYASVYEPMKAKKTPTPGAAAAKAAAKQEAKQADSGEAGVEADDGGGGVCAAVCSVCPTTGGAGGGVLAKKTVLHTR